MPSTADALDLPFDEAIAFFWQKTNVSTKSWTDVYAAAHSHSFMVAGAAGDALLDDFRAEIEKALTQGTTIDEFRKGFDGIVEKHGWQYKGKRGWRTRVIFDTNLRTAYAAGRYAQLTLPGTLEAFPFWTYNHSGAKHPRKEHLAWDGLSLPANDPFWQTNYPPNGWHCGCFVIPVSSAGLRRQGKSGPDEAPERLFRAEEVGGVTRRVPFGVDPGFEYNPGEAWLRRTAPGPRATVASPDLVAAFARRALSEGTGGKGWVPVEIVPDEIARAIDVPGGTELRLSADTIAEHRGSHPEATAEAYAAVLRAAIAQGEVYRMTSGHRILIDHEGERWLAVFKVTRAGEVYVTSLHRSNEKQWRRTRRSGERIDRGKDASGGAALPR